MKQYLAIQMNGNPDDNITFEATDFKEAARVLKNMIKEGTMFEQVKLVELDTLISRKYLF